MAERTAMRPTKYDQILAEIQKIGDKQADITELAETVSKHHKTLYGNGEEGLCEMVRTIRRDVSALPTKQDFITQSKKQNGEEGITFKWLTEKVFLPILWPLILVVVMAAYIIQNYVN